MLLLEEFYRSAVRLSGKPLLWLHLWVEDEKQYEAEVARLVMDRNNAHYGSVFAFIK